MMTRFSLRLSVLFGALFVLSACGGGGGGGGTTEVVPTAKPATPVLSIGFGIKQLQFSWPAATGASYYRLLENPDGVSGYTQVGGNITTTSASRDITIYRHDWPNARYMIEACNSLGCTASNEVNTVDSALKPIGYVKSTTSTIGDNFGYAAALSQDGNTLAVGALEASRLVAQRNGTVYLYARSTTGLWNLQATLVASNPDADDWFGNSLALSSDGNTLAVGALYEDGSGHGINPVPDDNSTDAGAVYLFSRSGTTWSAPVYIKASDLAKGFGTAVDLSDDGNLLAVGAPNSADGGHAYTFIRTSGVWSEKQNLTGNNTASGDSFGRSLALSGDGKVLAVGAPLEDSSTTGVNSIPDDLATDAGAVYVFTYPVGTTMSQYGYLKAYNTGAGDEFGHSVSLTFGTYYSLFVGAPNEDSNATGICLFDDAACITAQADNSAADAGAVYFYAGPNGASWTKLSYLKASNTGAGDYFGWSLAQSSDSFTLAVGAWGEDGSSPGIGGADNDNTPFSGAVYLFTKSGTTTWNHSAYVKAPNLEFRDVFGRSVALNGDGSTLAVGAVAEKSNSTLICATGDAACAAAQADNSAGGAGALYLY